MCVVVRGGWRWLCGGGAVVVVGVGGVEGTEGALSGGGAEAPAHFIDSPERT